MAGFIGFLIHVNSFSSDIGALSIKVTFLKCPFASLVLD